MIFLLVIGAIGIVLFGVALGAVSALLYVSKGLRA